MITYAEQLQSREWKHKRFQILQRDKFHCQHCGSLGISGTDVFIPLNRLEDISDYVEEKLWKLIFDSFWELACCYADTSINSQIEPEEAVFQIEDSLDMKGLENSVRKICRIKSNDWLNRHPNWTDELLYGLGGTDLNQDNDYLLLDKNMQITDKLIGRKRVIDSKTSICCFNIKNEQKDSYGLLNVTNNAMHVWFNNVEIDDDFVEDSVYFYTNLRKDREYNMPILDVHHKSYIYGHKAWEYSDDNLLTLCRVCHKKEHAEHEMMLYDENNRLLHKLDTCDRCGGTGYLPQYSYHESGLCFKCGGSGVLSIGKRI